MMRLKTFGGVALEGAPRGMGGAAAQRRPLALLLLLAAAGERGFSRDKLLGLLWPDSDAEHARSALRQTLYALRRDLGSADLVEGTADLRLNTELLSSDLAEFDAAVASRDRERVVALYEGPLADGFLLTKAPEFERWLEVERRARAQQFAAAAVLLAREASQAGDYARATTYWRRAASADRLSARVAVELMRSLAKAGDRAAAIQHARVYESIIRAELDAAPDPEVAALAAELRAAPPPAEAAGSEPRGGSFATPLIEAAAEPSAPAPGARDAVPGLTMQRMRRRMTVGVVAFVVAAVTGAAVYAGRNLARRPADPSLVAVAPYEVLDPALALWREGLMDILSRNLDGAGPLRTVAPSLAARHWPGGAHQASAAEFSRRTRAGIIVFGYLLRSGSDSVRALTSIMHVPSRQTVDVERREAVARMDRLTDSLTVAVLGQLDHWLPIGAVRRTTLGRTTSMEALRAFLRAEQFYRRTTWDSAQVWYEYAIARDSSFALPLQRLGNVFGWQRRTGDSLALAYKLRAGALNRGLGPRDSLLVLADSLSAAATAVPTFLEEWPFTPRLFATLAQGVRRYPDDPEMWYALGDARYHFGFGPVLGVPERSTLDAFDRAIALDSAFAPSYVHMPELALNLGGPGVARRYIEAYLRRNAPHSPDESTRLLRFLLAPGGWRPDELARVLDTVPGDVLSGARSAVRRWPDSAETALHLSRRLLVNPQPGRYGPIRDSSHRAMLLASQLAFRGHVREAHRVIGTADRAISFQLAYVGGAPADSIDARLRRFAERGSEFTPLAMRWWAQRGDTARLHWLLREARQRAVRGPATLARLTGAYDTAAALAHLALVRHDTVEALRRFAALPDTLCPRCYPDRFTRATLLAALGLNRQALVGLNEALVGIESPLEVLMAFERGRVAERLGERATARDAYRFVVDAWRFGDPEVQPTVAEARRGLARLGAGESRR